MMMMMMMMDYKIAHHNRNVTHCFVISKRKPFSTTNLALVAANNQGTESIKLNLLFRQQ